MIIEFSTKRDRNGNRYYLGINTFQRTFSRERGKWYSREDVIEISRKKRRELIEKLEAENFKEKPYLLHENK